MMKAVKNMKMNEYEAVIEAALFVAGEEVSLSALADMIEMDKATTKAIVNTLITLFSITNIFKITNHIFLAVHIIWVHTHSICEKCCQAKKSIH